MAVKVVAQIASYAYDGTTLSIFLTLQALNNPEARRNFSGLAVNIADAAAVTAFLKTQIINFVAAQYSATVVASEIALFNAPQ